jgi:outer membrane protein, heavy metal efflux system
MKVKVHRRTLRTGAAAFAAVLAWAVPVAAQDGKAALSLHDAFVRAAPLLPETAASPALKERTDAQIREAKGPFVGPPVVRGDLLTRSGGLIEQEVSVSAAIKWPGEARAGITAAALSGDAATKGLGAAELVLAGEVRAAYWRLAAAQGAADIEQQHVVTARMETEQIVRLVREGVRARRDLLVSQAELGAAMGQLSAAENDVTGAAAAFEALIGAVPEAFTEEVLTPDKDIESHPALIAADTRARAAAAKAGYLRYGVRPRVEGTIGVRRERNDLRGPFGDALLVGIAVPMGRDARALVSAAETSAEALSKGAEAARVRMHITAQQRASHAQLSVAERALNDAKARQSALREALMLTQRGVAEGELGYIEYLRARQALFDAERALVAADVGKSAAISNVNQMMGVLP